MLTALLVLAGLLIGGALFLRMSAPYVGGLPGYGAVLQTSPKIVFLDGKVLWGLAGGKIISGGPSRDPGNTGNIDVLRPGVLMGKLSSVVNSLGTVGRYAPSIIGPTTASYTAGGTSLTVGVATATEIVRRCGATGTFNLTGPPAAAGVVVTQLVTYSAVDLGTGVITITALGANAISGSLVQPTDGSEDMLTLISEFFSAGTGVKVTDAAGASQDQPFDFFPIGGVLVAANLINYPSDASLIDWVHSSLSSIPGGKFAFTDVY